jgi:pre-mRNA-processing factor 40
MPEEFRLWRERIEAVEKKKGAGGGSGSLSAKEAALALKAAEAKAREQKKESEAERASSIAYSSTAEALEAFKELLAFKKISVSAKMKEVVDACQDDERWEALKSLSQGDKKQVLAEYQTKKLKQEKDIQKMKARKHRDAFLLMLAENTDIDARTRWRDAIEILQEDHRYKNVEDPREREDLFRDFGLELEKKEKEDKKKQRETATEFFIKTLKDSTAAGTVSRKSIWAETKKELVNLLCRPELKGLDDSDMRRTFQEYVSELEEVIFSFIM